MKANQTQTTQGRIEMKPLFTVGSKMTIYQHYLTQDQPIGEATLIKCLRDSSRFPPMDIECMFPAQIVEEWEVRFDGESKIRKQIIAVKEEGKMKILKRRYTLKGELR